MHRRVSSLRSGGEYNPYASSTSLLHDDSDADWKTSTRRDSAWWNRLGNDSGSRFFPAGTHHTRATPETTLVLEESYISFKVQEAYELSEDNFSMDSLSDISRASDKFAKPKSLFKSNAKKQFRPSISTATLPPPPMVEPPPMHNEFVDVEHEDILDDISMNKSLSLHNDSSIGNNRPKSIFKSNVSNKKVNFDNILNVSKDASNNLSDHLEDPLRDMTNKPKKSLFKSNTQRKSKLFADAVSFAESNKSNKFEDELESSQSLADIKQSSQKILGESFNSSQTKQTSFNAGKGFLQDDFENVNDNQTVDHEATTNVNQSFSSTFPKSMRNTTTFSNNLSLIDNDLTLPNKSSIHAQKKSLFKSSKPSEKSKLFADAMSVTESNNSDEEVEDVDNTSPLGKLNDMETFSQDEYIEDILEEVIINRMNTSADVPNADYNVERTSKTTSAPSEDAHDVSLERSASSSIPVEQIGSIEKNKKSHFKTPTTPSTRQSKLLMETIPHSEAPNSETLSNEVVEAQELQVPGINVENIQREVSVSVAETTLRNILDTTNQIVLNVSNTERVTRSGKKLSDTSKLSTGVALTNISTTNVSSVQDTSSVPKKSLFKSTNTKRKSKLFADALSFTDSDESKSFVGEMDAMQNISKQINGSRNVKTAEENNVSRVTETRGNTSITTTATSVILETAGVVNSFLDKTNLTKDVSLRVNKPLFKSACSERKSKLFAEAVSMSESMDSILIQEDAIVIHSVPEQSDFSKSNTGSIKVPENIVAEEELLVTDDTTDQRNTTVANQVNETAANQITITQETTIQDESISVKKSLFRVGSGLRKSKLFAEAISFAESNKSQSFAAEDVDTSRNITNKGVKVDQNISSVADKMQTEVQINISQINKEMKLSEVSVDVTLQNASLTNKSLQKELEKPAKSLFRSSNVQRKSKLFADAVSMISESFEDESRQDGNVSKKLKTSHIVEEIVTESNENVQRNIDSVPTEVIQLELATEVQDIPQENEPESDNQDETLIDDAAVNKSFVLDKSFVQTNGSVRRSMTLRNRSIQETEPSPNKSLSVPSRTLNMSVTLTDKQIENVTTHASDEEMPPSQEAQEEIHLVVSQGNTIESDHTEQLAVTDVPDNQMSNEEVKTVPPVRSSLFNKSVNVSIRQLETSSANDSAVKSYSNGTLVETQTPGNLDTSARRKRSSRNLNKSVGEHSQEVEESVDTSNIKSVSVAEVGEEVSNVPTDIENQMIHDDSQNQVEISVSKVTEQSGQGEELQSQSNLGEKSQSYTMFSASGKKDGSNGSASNLSQDASGRMSQSQSQNYSTMFHISQQNQASDAVDSSQNNNSELTSSQQDDNTQSKRSIDTIEEEEMDEEMETSERRNSESSDDNIELNLSPNDDSVERRYSSLPIDQNLPENELSSYNDTAQESVSVQPTRRPTLELYSTFKPAPVKLIPTDPKAKAERERKMMQFLDRITREVTKIRKEAEEEVAKMLDMTVPQLIPLLMRDPDTLTLPAQDKTSEQIQETKISKKFLAGIGGVSAAKKKKRGERNRRISTGRVNKKETVKKAKLYMKELWITRKLYNFIQSKLKNKYGLMYVKKSETFVKYLSNIVNSVEKSEEGEEHVKVEELKVHMANMDIITTHRDFVAFVHNYLPHTFRIKSIPAPGRDVPRFRGKLDDTVLRRKK